MVLAVLLPLSHMTVRVPFVGVSPRFYSCTEFTAAAAVVAITILRLS